MDLKILEIASNTENHKVVKNHTHLSKNKKIDQIKHLFSSVESFFDNTEIKINKEWEDFKKILNKKNISRKECLLLPFRTISKALKFKL